MSEKTCKTPLIDSLRSVPIKHRTKWEFQWAADGTPTGHAMSPVGMLCHDAAERIAELESELKQIHEITIPELQLSLGEAEAKLERVEEVRNDLATQCLNSHAVKMLDKALKDKSDET